MKRFKAFTLAETLITLGIIGVVAAMTMPTLIQNHQKQSTAVSLKKFYSIINQTLLRWQIDNGYLGENYQFPANTINNGEESLKWFLENFDKYLNITDSEVETSRDFKVAFNDGSGFSAYIANEYNMNIFYCTKYKYCHTDRHDGNKTFLFAINKGRLYTSQYSMQNFDRETLLSECKYGNSYGGVSLPGRRHTCTRLIEYDGWQIKDDYPWKQTILDSE